MADILVVDDDDTMREFMCNGLTAHGHRVCLATNGIDALQQLRAHPVSVVVSDVRMPGMDGFSFVKALRLEPALGRPEVVFVSVLDDRKYYRRALQVGAADYLVKPFSVKDLADAIARSLASRAANRLSTLPRGAYVQDPTHQIDGYEIIQKLGEGSDSMVFLANHVASGEQHALKILRQASTHPATQPSIRRFMAEYDMLSRLTHPNVARVYAHGIGDRCLYIGMEFLPGGDLRLDILSGMSAPLALKRAAEIASALAAIHGAGIIHRDLKPSNILMRMTGEAVIADFGIAKQLGTAMSHTSTHAAVGTPYYMSPEQATGAQVAAASDIYALGVLLFEMFTGVRPFDAATPNELMGQHVNAPIPPLPRALRMYQPLIEKMLAKNPEDRFSSALVTQVALDKLARS